MSVSSLVRPALRGAAAYHVPHPPGIKVKLDANESPFVLPAEVATALAAQLAQVELNRYPAPDGGTLRSVVADWLGVGGDRLAFGNGSDELIAFLVSTFAAPRPGSDCASVVYPVPSFSVYRIAAHACGVEPIEVPLASDFSLDAAALRTAMATARPNTAFFARPNNPTGTLWSRAVLVELLESHRDTLIVVDEAYIDYGGDSMLDVLDAHPNLVVLRTASKIGLAALRIGVLIAAPEIVAEVEKVRPPYNLGGLNQRAAEWLLTHHRDLLQGQCAEVARERDRVMVQLAARADIEPFASSANLILFRVVAPARAAELWQRLADRGILVRKFEGALADCLRVTIGRAEDNDAFLKALS